MVTDGRTDTSRGPLTARGAEGKPRSPRSKPKKGAEPGDEATNDKLIKHAKPKAASSSQVSRDEQSAILLPESGRQTGRLQEKPLEFRAEEDNWLEREEAGERGGKKSGGEVREERRGRREKGEGGGEGRGTGGGGRREGKRREREDAKGGSGGRVVLRGRGVHVFPTTQSDELAQQLASETYDCMVCCERVRAKEYVWSCANCYHVFHLRCAEKWATSPAAAMDEGVTGSSPLIVN